MRFETQLRGEIDRWRENSFISEEQAAKLRSLYPSSAANYNVALILFSILGALLIGGGIILIFGRNWDELPIWGRTAFSFLPLILSQILTAALLLKKTKSEAWREGAGLFYAVSVYACVALIGQTYQMQGGFEEYLLLCSLLILPIGYVLRATAPTLVYIVGITVWAANYYGYYAFAGGSYGLLYCLGLTALAVPHLWFRLKENARGAYSQLLLWCLAICGFVIALTRLSFAGQEFLVVSLYFSVLYLISARWMNEEAPPLLQPLKAVGFIGSLVTLFTLSFGGYVFWRRPEFIGAELPQWIVCGVLLLFYLTLIPLNFDAKKPLKSARTLLIGGSFIVSLVMRLATPADSPRFLRIEPLSYIWVNFYILAIGVALIIDGLRESRFSRACLGTALIAAIVICRFFDTRLDFFARGVAFILVGAAFLSANLFIAKRMKGAGREASNAENT